MSGGMYGNQAQGQAIFTDDVSLQVFMEHRKCFSHDCEHMSKPENCYSEKVSCVLANQDFRPDNLTLTDLPFLDPQIEGYAVT